MDEYPLCKNCGHENYRHHPKNCQGNLVRGCDCANFQAQIQGKKVKVYEAGETIRYGSYIAERDGKMYACEIKSSFNGDREFEKWITPTSQSQESECPLKRAHSGVMVHCAMMSHAYCPECWGKCPHCKGSKLATPKEGD